MSLNNQTGKNAGKQLPSSKNSKPGPEELGADTDDPLVAAPGFSLSEIHTEISVAQALVADAAVMSEDLFLKEIKVASERFGGFALQAKRSSTEALLYPRRLSHSRLFQMKWLCALPLPSPKPG